MIKLFLYIQEFIQTLRVGTACTIPNSLNIRNILDILKDYFDTTSTV